MNDNDEGVPGGSREGPQTGRHGGTKKSPSHLDVGFGVENNIKDLRRKAVPGTHLEANLCFLSVSWGAESGENGPGGRRTGLGPEYCSSFSIYRRFDALGQACPN
jgi:hypothetical protein